ncbi:AMP-binding protein [Myxococcus stipitatus]|uniref:AMP-binding protein n=1 Tax=Myxococcus stipitatus TaxID=83455 RepID=UPI001F41AF39|nr:AMP-binding protein [Myxococcus stipitatus]MCE9667277.1 AMP-binding protein [Myxococcus stipitatus]
MTTSTDAFVPPKAHFSSHAHVQTLEDYQRLYRRSIEQPEAFWGEMARQLTWFHPPETVREVNAEQVDFAWFSGGKLNAAFNAVDRHARERPGKAAILWAKNEPGEYETITFRDLHHHVGRVANVLKAHGVRKGDRVCIYLPMIPELAYTMLACARIGAVHSVVFAGFSSESLRERILDCGAKVLVTANEGPRGPKSVHTKAIADEAVEGLTQVSSVLVVRRTSRDVPMADGRDFWLDTEMAKCC